MNKVKNYALLIIFVVALVEGFILYTREPKVLKSVTYSSSKTNFTGATNATLLPNGNLTVSGSNLSVSTFSQNKTENTFNYNGIYAGISVISDLRTVRACGELSYVNRDIVATLGYTPSTGELNVGFMKSVIVW